MKLSGGDHTPPPKGNALKVRCKNRGCNLRGEVGSFTVPALCPPLSPPELRYLDTHFLPFRALPTPSTVQLELLGYLDLAYILA